MLKKKKKNSTTTKSNLRLLPQDIISKKVTRLVPIHNGYHAIMITTEGSGLIAKDGTILIKPDCDLEDGIICVESPNILLLRRKGKKGLFQFSFENPAYDHSIIPCEYDTISRYPYFIIASCEDTCDLYNSSFQKVFSGTHIEFSAYCKNDLIVYQGRKTSIIRYFSEKNYVMLFESEQEINYLGATSPDRDCFDFLVTYALGQRVVHIDNYLNTTYTVEKECTDLYLSVYPDKDTNCFIGEKHNRADIYDTKFHLVFSNVPLDFKIIESNDAIYVRYKKYNKYGLYQKSKKSNFGLQVFEHEFDSILASNDTIDNCLLIFTAVSSNKISTFVEIVPEVIYLQNNILHLGRGVKSLKLDIQFENLVRYPYEYDNSVYLITSRYNRDYLYHDNVLYVMNSIIIPDDIFLKEQNDVIKLKLDINTIQSCYYISGEDVLNISKEMLQIAKIDGIQMQDIQFGKFSAGRYCISYQEELFGVKIYPESVIYSFFYGTLSLEFTVAAVIEAGGTKGILRNAYSQLDEMGSLETYLLESYLNK